MILDFVIELSIFFSNIQVINSVDVSKEYWIIILELSFFFFQNEATFPLVRKGYYKESPRRLIHTSESLPPIKFKKVSLLT